MNREIFPGGLYPLQGDVTSQPGSQNATVTGIQGVPVASTTMSGGERLEYNPVTRQWVPNLRASIQVNNESVSDDYLITVNVAKPVLVNGV